MTSNPRGALYVLHKQSISSVRINRSQEATGSVTYITAPYLAAVSLKPIVGVSVHPDWPELTAESVEIIRGRGDTAMIHVEYRGPAYEATKAEEIEVNVAPTMIENSIVTHPDFETWAGTPASPAQTGGVDNAKFGRDEPKEFIGFTSTYDLWQVKDWLVPGCTASVTEVVSGVPSLTALGTVVISAPYLPRVRSNFNWMIMGLPYERFGTKYKVTTEYLLSGPKGWNKKVYKKRGTGS